MSVQTKLTAILFCPIWLTASARVRPFLASETETSATVPVREPSGSPLARSSGLGASMDFTSTSVRGTGAAAGGEAGGVVGAGAGVCAHIDTARRRAGSRRLVMSVLPLPQSVLQKGRSEEHT